MTQTELLAYAMHSFTAAMQDCQSDDAMEAWELFIGNLRRLGIARIERDREDAAAARLRARLREEAD